MKKLIENISDFLPLSIHSIEWNDPNLIIIGENWKFSTVSSWRLIKKNKLICGCYDVEAIEVIKEIKDLSINSIDVQSIQLLVDPVFIFSNEYKLEIFATTFFEPWIFEIPSGLVYVASPSE